MEVSANLAIVNFMAVDKLFAVLVSCFSKSVSFVVTIERILLILGIVIPMICEIMKFRYFCSSRVKPLVC